MQRWWTACGVTGMQASEAATPPLWSGNTPLLSSTSGVTGEQVLHLVLHPRAQEGELCHSGQFIFRAKRVGLVARQDRLLHLHGGHGKGGHILLGCLLLASGTAHSVSLVLMQPHIVCLLC